MSKTSKRPERPFGGVLCSSCMRVRVRYAARDVASVMEAAPDVEKKPTEAKSIKKEAEKKE